MSNPQKNKGKNYERTIAEIFTNTFNKPFMRVPNSGAYCGGQNVVRIDKMSANQVNMFSGDIIPPEDFSILIECKARKEFKFHLMLRKQGNLDLNSWIEQASIDYEKSKQALMLVIFRPNNMGDYVCFEKVGFMDSTRNLLEGTNYIRYMYKGKQFIITELQEFLTLNKERIEALCLKK